MFDNIPTNFTANVRTPDPIVVKIEPSSTLIAIMAGVVVVAAAWVKKRT
ncbi:hypothetical protein L2750_12780 [Shewanella submarina]|uniref:PEP-CTERM sorting domain-containing protein n=1 Tax=Shewanella submarina TaxID=2016376 RepID=A0ABV7GDP0_9GAMM|nr:hypothetical protein [Shewanella submarina]MCL1038024.1 hypothetical protein [Shewanella submarina]